ncbi:hypothetical protein [Parachitinimonas caeni]|uniref:Uncharacterized protein n=1 Tax=Parachitinimonas caeni TaxID=3031301 RepID=A0ABT7E1E7_9NEIS|nr:hypothetical protein [Parachitinimonas caeni]MDK2126121.1 hypothetical protein [Parachitinimonas caeni]
MKYKKRRKGLRWHTITQQCRAATQLGPRKTRSQPEREREQAIHEEKPLATTSAKGNNKREARPVRTPIRRRRSSTKTKADNFKAGKKKAAENQRLFSGMWRKGRDSNPR